MLPCRNQTPRRGRQTWTGRTLQNPNFHSPSTYICSCDMYVSMWDISESPHVFLHDPAQSPAPRLSREGSTIHDTVRDLCLTLSPFCNFLSPSPSGFMEGQAKGRTANQAHRQMQCLALVADSFGEEARERGLWASPCGDVEQEASGREVCSRSLGSLWSGRASPRLEADSHRIYCWLNCTHILLALAVLQSSFSPL